MTMPADVQGFARHHSFGSSSTYPICPEQDPRRGVGCALTLGHKGDHESIGGFPFSRTQLDPAEKPSEADLAAARSMLSEAGITPDWDTRPAMTAVEIAMEKAAEMEDPDAVCDDCGLRNSIHNPEVDH